MSWSLQIRNGDLTLGPARYGTVSNEAKLVQDLRCWLLERIGTDDMHPTFGSILDGGTSPAGDGIAGVVGMSDPDLALTLAEAEIRRIVREYQAVQLVRARREHQQYGKTTFSKGEILLSLNAMDVEQSFDVLNIRLHLTTAAETLVELDLPLTL